MFVKNPEFSQVKTTQTRFKGTVKCKHFTRVDVSIYRLIKSVFSLGVSGPTFLMCRLKILCRHKRERIRHSLLCQSY